MATRKKRFCRDCGVDIRLRDKRAIYCKKCANQRKMEINRINARRFANEHREEYIKQVKECSKRKTFVVHFFMAKYKCFKVKELYEKIKNGQID